MGVGRGYGVGFTLVGRWRWFHSVLVDGQRTQRRERSRSSCSIGARQSGPTDGCGTRSAGRTTVTIHSQVSWCWTGRLNRTNGTSMSPEVEDGSGTSSLRGRVGT